MSSSEVEVQPEVPGSTLTDELLDRRTLFVRSIPTDATSEQLSEFFSDFAPVKHAVIVNDENQKSRGFGFVSFTMDDDCLQALVDARKNKFQGRFLRVDVAKRRERKDSKSPAKKIEKSAPVEKRRSRLIIRNLPWSCKKPETLKNIFQRYGAVFDAYIPKKKGGQMCGFAFVTMKKDSAAKAAVEGSKGLKIDGREVAVDLALEKSKWEAVKEDEEEEEGEVEDEEEEEDDDEKENDDDEDDEKDEENSFDKLNEIDSDAEVDEEEVEEEEVKEVKSYPKQNKQEAYSVFVRNIPYDATSESLKEHFLQFGAVKYALPVIDKESGLAKGTAFVAFVKEDAYSKCLDNAPTTATLSVLIPDDVPSEYVYDGRILSISSAVDRESAGKLAEKNLLKRKEILGKAPGEKDKRNLFLLNEGRITEQSKLAQYILKTDLELREKSYKLRVQQLNKNPTLHLSMTRLAIRNLPRAMNAKALKALGRKAVVQFATEVKNAERLGLSKEEISRSNAKEKWDKEALGEDKDKDKKKTKNSGVIKQAKVIMEVKGSGDAGRSRGYGFLEFRDHKSALMGLRWLNAHEVSIPEILEGLTEEEKLKAEFDGLAKRRLITEFAIENAKVIKRRRDNVMQSRSKGSGNRDEGRSYQKRDRDEVNGEDDYKNKNKKMRKGSSKKGNMNKGPKNPDSAIEKSTSTSTVSEDVKKIISQKRARRKAKK